MHVEISKHEQLSKLLNLEIDCITLDNEKMSVQILNYGCTMLAINVPDKDGKVGNILLNYEDVDSILVNPLYLNNIIGPNAGRLENAVLNLDGATYELEKNDVSGNLHGGGAGFHKKLWEIRQRSVEMNFCGVSLFHRHEHLTGGFPGNIDIHVNFRLFKDNRLTVEFSAVADRRCHLNMANHNYFNLSGDFGIKLDEHKLFVNAKAYRPLRGDGIPVSESQTVLDTPFDYRVSEKISKSFVSPFGGIDHPFDLEAKLDPKKPSVILEDPLSGRKMKISSNQPCVVIYTNNVGYKHHEGICFEFQHYPNETHVLDPDQVYGHFTEYYFE
jgi:aldose 1-epimerase